MDGGRSGAASDGLCSTSGRVSMTMYEVQDLLLTEVKSGSKSVSYCLIGKE